MIDEEGSGIAEWFGRFLHILFTFLDLLSGSTKKICSTLIDTYHLECPSLLCSGTEH